MKRRAFLSGVAATTAAGISRPVYGAGKKFRWRMVLAIPKNLPIWGPGMLRFAETVEELSGGQLRIRVYGAGELIPALGTFDAVSSGEVQMGHAAAYYWQGKLPAAPFFTAVPFGLEGTGALAWIRDGGGQALYDELMAPYHVRCIPCGNTGHQATGWFNKEIKSLKDLQGLKIRIPGLAGKVYAALGASPVLIPGGELYTSLSTGVIDAAEWVGPYHDYVLGLPKAASRCYLTSWHEPGSLLELMINKTAWEELPEALKTCIEIAAGDTCVWMQSRWESKNAEYLEKIEQEGKVTIAELPDEVLQAMKKESQKLLLELANTGPLAKKIYDSYSTFQKRFESFNRRTTRGYYASLDWG